MKKMLRLSVVLMLLAGIYGFTDMLLDVHQGTYITYEHDTPLHTLQKKVQVPVSLAVIKKGQSLASITASVMQRAVLNSAHKKRKHNLEIADLDVRNFSRGDIPIDPEMLVAEMDSASVDSIKPVDHKTSKAFLVQAKRDSTHP
ncbi:MAG TPA: hypothetical protein VNZ86_13305 [Bacteroidia bacterium]|jgi:hypothetical protein|nr:hypothetical protein [Bacteroidia bacterium]